jgi:hypothetical protein
MNVLADLSKVLEITLFTTIRDELYLNWERRNLCRMGESKLMALNFV